MIKLTASIVLSLLFITKSYVTFAQDEIIIFNPSFEDPAKRSTLPILWENCGSVNSSPSDIHSNSSDLFNVQKTAQDGTSFVGMTVREDVTWEAMAQKLEQPLLKNNQYQFSIHLARSDSYRNVIKKLINRYEVAFTDAAVLRIWGGDDSNYRGQLLAESLPIEHTDWQEYTFEFEPIDDWDYFVLEAFFKDENGFAYNGNLLLDNCSEIYAFSKLKLSEITDYSVLTRQGLLNLVIDCKTDDANLRDTSILDKIYDSWLFQRTCQEIGMKELVTRMDTITLQNYLDFYYKIGLVKSAEIIEKTRFLYKKDSPNISEIRYLKNSNDLFQKSLKTERINDKRLEFIRRNKTMIVEQLKQCDR
jgi:hypothetical protein